MRGLLEQHFHGVDSETFQHDLAGKNWVVLLEDEHGILKGFSTCQIYATNFNARAMTVVCSGDTIVDPSAWGSTALPRAWIHAVHDLRRHFPAGEFYWLLLTSGFRTYRFLPVFYRCFYPRFDQITPPDMHQVLDALASERFGSLYDKNTGLVRFPKPQRLREHLGELPDGRVVDPHIRFFIERNPQHADGDELVSLASLDLENLTPAGRRMLR